MYTANQTPEQKRKNEKMNMVLNNLEQQLYENEELCKGIAKIIDMTIETNTLVSRLEQVQTSIPAIEERILNLIDSCVLSCAEYRKNTTIQIYDMYTAECGEPKAVEKLMKIHKTIDACVADYKTYTQSQYYKKYSSKEESTQDSTALSISELLIL